MPAGFVECVPGCRTASGQSGEECLDRVVATYVVTGFSDIEVEAGAGGSFRGVETNLNVKFKAARFGSKRRTGRRDGCAP